MNPTTLSNDAMNHAHDDPGSPEQLARIDLNLLVAFDVLAQERNVTRAAERIGVTQSALSHSLRRLRELLGDPLLVRAREGMVLTSRAEALVVPLRAALLTVGRALDSPGAFEPRTARRTFTLASPDLFDVLVVPPLLARVRGEAPGVEMTVVSSHDAQLAQRLETGDVDFAILPHIHASRVMPPAPPPQGLAQTTLFRDGFSCLLRADHAALGKRRTLSLDAYCALPHVLVAPRGAGPGPVDEVLEKLGRQRRVVLRVPNFYAALPIVARSDLVLTAPSSLGAIMDSGLKLALLAPPLQLPEHTVNVLWHERFANDPAHRWLRELLIAVARGVLRDLPRRRARPKR
jgi:DNA-binding transcriptional LysR family regulator